MRALVETELKNDLSLLEQEIIDNTRKSRPYLERKIEKSELKQKKFPKKK